METRASKKCPIWAGVEKRPTAITPPSLPFFHGISRISQTFSSFPSFPFSGFFPVPLKVPFLSSLPSPFLLGSYRRIGERTPEKEKEGTNWQFHLLLSFNICRNLLFFPPPHPWKKIVFFPSRKLQNLCVIFLLLVPTGAIGHCDKKNCRHRTGETKFYCL